MLRRQPPPNFSSLLTKTSILVLTLQLLVTSVVATKTFSLDDWKNGKMVGTPHPDILISFPKATCTSAKDLVARLPKGASRGDRATVIERGLRACADKTQADVQNYLTSQGIPFTSYWISNQIYVPSIDPQHLVLVAEFFGPAVAMSYPITAMLPFLPASTVPVACPTSVTSNWGLEAIGWHPDCPYLGQGIVVAIIDTGYTFHAALAQNMVPNGIADCTVQMPNGTPTKGQATDTVGHGTHCLGTMAAQGSNYSVGVASSSTWMACKAFTEIGGREPDILCAMQWYLCPYKDSEGNCDGNPHIINNSWGGPPGGSTFEVPINALMEAGTYCFFANGNDGSDCATANSPGNQENVISAGACSLSGVADFSSRGSDSGGITKPDMTAPGVDIVSCSHTQPTSCVAYSGTSMASPHLAGVAACVLSMCPGLSFDELRRVMECSCLPKFPAPECGPTDQSIPNNDWGYGMVSLPDALDCVYEFRLHDPEFCNPWPL